MRSAIAGPNRNLDLLDPWAAHGPAFDLMVFNRASFQINAFPMDKFDMGVEATRHPDGQANLQAGLRTMRQPDGCAADRGPAGSMFHSEMWAVRLPEGNASVAARHVYSGGYSTSSLTEMAGDSRTQIVARIPG